MSLKLRYIYSSLPPAVSFDGNFIVVSIIGSFIWGTDHNSFLPEIAISWISLLELRARMFFHIEWQFLAIGSTIPYDIKTTASIFSKFDNRSLDVNVFTVFVTTSTVICTTDNVGLTLKLDSTRILNPVS